MKKSVIIILSTILLPVVVLSQSISTSDSLILKGKDLLKEAIDHWEEPELLQARAHFERLIGSKSHPELVYYYLAMADLRLGIFYISQKKNEQALQFINEGITYSEKSIALAPEFADAHSLRSSLLGNKIGLKPLLGMMLGPKSNIAMRKAMEYEPANPRNYLIAGQSAYYTPRMFGGGKDKAKLYFERAIALYDSVHQSDPLQPEPGHV